MGKYIDYKTFNPIYAPGLSTYASKGEMGDSGENGTAIYYNKNSIKRNSTERNFVNQKIKNNELLTSSTSESNNSLKYKEFDLVIDSDGDVYYIVSENDGLMLGETPIGNISASIKKNYIVVESGDSFKIVSTLDEGSKDNYLYNVYLSKETEEEEIERTVLYACSTDTFYELNGALIDEIEIIDKNNGKTAIFIEHFDREPQINQ